MSKPTQKQSSRTKRKRASHFALTAKVGTACSACGALRLPHHACTACGMYRGRSVVNTAKRAARSASKKA